MTTRSNLDFKDLRQTGRHPSGGTPGSTIRFWDRIAERYAAKPVPSQEIYKRKLAITRDYLTADSEVLELGCGTGSTALAHACYVRKICATDFSSKMIEIASRKAVTAKVDNVEFVCSTVGGALAPGTQYDAILALSLLHLMDDWRSTIKEAYRKLKPGGVFVTSTPCLMDSHAWLRWLVPIGARAGLMPQIVFFTQDEFRSELANAGFEVEHAWRPNPRNGLFLIARRAP